jgi:MFS family permease
VPAGVAGVGLVIGGLGMGLSMSSNAVLLFDLSPIEDRGANSAAIQMSDSLGGVLVIGAAGVFYALEREVLAPTTLYLVIFAFSVMVLALATVVAFRVRPRVGG